VLPAAEGLVPEPYNSKLMTLVFRLAEWHALAKLRMHTERTLDHLDQATVAIGQEMRSFRDWTQALGTTELPGEASARQRRKSKKDAAKKTSSHSANSHAAPSQTPPGSSSKTASGTKNSADLPASSRPQKNGGPSAKEPKVKNKLLNLLTYKMHALGDYVQSIRLFGTTDSYSTQIVDPSVFSWLL
jgi:hypothetical protein